VYIILHIYKVNHNNNWGHCRSKQIFG